MPALLPTTSRAHLFNAPHLKVTAGAFSVQGLEHVHNEDREYISPQHDQRNARSAAFDLVRLAVDQGAKDDVTALVFAVGEVPARNREAEVATPLLGRWKRLFSKAFKGALAPSY